MRSVDSLTITSNQQDALHELRQRLHDHWGVETLILFGSVARGDEDDESDLDLLVVTPQPLTRFARHEITDVVFEVNLRHGTNLSTLVVDHTSWESGPYSVLPIHDEILADGITL